MAITQQVISQYQGFAVWVSQIKDSSFVVAIGGFKATIRDPKSFIKMISEACVPQATQIFDAWRVAGRDHLFMAAVNAARSMKMGTPISKNITVETILYASAQDQITKALALMGVTTKSNSVALLVFAQSREEAEKAYNRAAKLLGEEDDTVLDIDETKSASLRITYDIRDEELEAAGGLSSLSSLIVERGALLSFRH